MHQLPQDFFPENHFIKQTKINLEWAEMWRKAVPKGGEFVSDPTQPLLGFTTASRKQWVTANRIRSRHNRTAANLNKWKLRDSPICPACGTAPQDTDHLVKNCPTTKIIG